MLGEQFTLSAEGAGVHWQCRAQRGTASCLTACFEVGGPKYLISFLHEEELATGRTNSLEATLDDIEDWLQHRDVVRLHERFSFVDQNKRALLHIRDIVMKQVPDLSSPATSLKSSGSDTNALWF